MVKIDTSVCLQNAQRQDRANMKGVTKFLMIFIPFESTDVDR